jgi:hypothetical protein
MASAATSVTVQKSPPPSPPFARSSRARSYSESSDDSVVEATYSMIMMQEDAEKSKIRELEETVEKMKGAMASLDSRVRAQDQVIHAHSQLGALHSHSISSLTAQLEEAQKALSHLDEVEARSSALALDVGKLSLREAQLVERVEGLEVDSAEKDTRISRSDRRADDHEATLVKLKLMMLATGTFATAGFGGALSGAIMGAKIAPAIGHGVASGMGLLTTGYGMTGVHQLHVLDRV